MVLKVQLDGAKKTLTSPGRAPITFINGVKKRLIKGITFVNGQKVVLWDSHNMVIDYVSGVGDLLGYIPTAVCAGKEKIMLTGNDKIVSRINVANTSSPFIENSVANGLITSYSNIDSKSSNNVVFYGRVPGERPNRSTFAQIQINPVNLDLAVFATYNWTYGATVNGSVAPVQMGSDWWSISTYTTAAVYLNNNRQYTFTQYVSNQVNQINSTMVKVDATHCVGALFKSGDSPVHGIGIYTSGGVTPLVSGREYSSVLVCSDGNYLAAGPSGVGLYTPQGSAILSIDATLGYNYHVLGQIRDLYYIVQEPAPSNTPLSGVTLIILTTEGVVKERTTLNLTVQGTSAANPNPYGSHIGVIPHISKTGFLAFYWSARPGYTTADDRLVRIEGY